MEKCTVSIELRSVRLILQVISLKLVVCLQRYFAGSMFNAEGYIQGFLSSLR